MASKNKKRSKYFAKQYRIEKDIAERKAFKERERKRQKGAPKAVKQHLKVTSALVREVAKKRGTSVRFVSKWLNVLKPADRDRFIKESGKVEPFELMQITDDMDSLTKSWTVARFVKELEIKRTKIELAEAIKTLTIINQFAADVFKAELLAYLNESVVKIVVTAPLPVADRAELKALTKEWIKN